MHLESTPTWLIGPQIPPTERIGTVLSGSYRLDAFLGQGMTGFTYNAWHLRQKQPYAVKLLHRELQPSHERVSRLRQDLRTLSGLRRFGFLPVELSFAPDGAPFLASELLTGETLRSRLSHGPLPVLAAGIVTAALARALGEAHQQGIVHGDLRPENVLLPAVAGREVEAGQPVLVDAALHHLRRRPIGLDETLPIGKLVYLAPEQASGEQPIANASGDLFALGAILYECLTGQQAFAAAELEGVLEKLAAPPQKLVLAREVGAPPGLAAALDAVIAKACARDPEDRYATMADFLQALDQAFAKSGLPLPPPDERVSIDTVKAQNRELRKRTVVVKKVVPLAPMAELPETSGVMSAAAFAHLSSLMSSASTPESGEPAAAKSEAAAAPEGKPAEGRRITAKNRIVRRTVRARDLSRLLTDIESGKLDVAQAMALAAKEDEKPEPDDAVPEPATDSKSEARRIIEEGRAAVIARAEAAKKNRETETKERQQREQAAAQEMQRRLLEQARQETLGRMRAEWELSRPVQKVSAKELAAESKPAPAAAAAPDPQQAELLAEAQRQKERLEAERKEAERRAAEEAEKARAEAQAAEAARKESARLEAELRAAERREAERAEAVRRQAELEAEARRVAEQAEQARAAKQAEAETRLKEAEQARLAAEAKQREAEAAKQAAENSDEAALWADTFELMLEDDKPEQPEQPDRTIPPPIPAAAMRARTEAARRAEAEAQRAQAEAAAAAAAAQQARSDAAEIEQQAAVARRAQEEAAAARDREAAELAAAVEAAEDVRAQDQALFRQVLEAEQRAKVAEAARVANVALMTRVTQALQVIRQVQTLVDEEPAGEAAPVATSSADTGRWRTGRPTGGERGEAAPAGPLANEITGRTAVPAPAANTQSAPETSSGYAAFQITAGPVTRDASGAYPAAQLAAAGGRSEPANPSAAAAPLPSSPATATPPEPRAEGSAGYPAAQLAAAGSRLAGAAAPTAQPGHSTRSPVQPAAPAARGDLSAAYAAAQLPGAGGRAEPSAAYPAAQMAGAGARPEPSAAYPAAQMAGAGARPEPSAAYPAAQMAGAGARPEPSAAYPAAQMAGAGARPEPSAAYAAAQLAAAGVRPDASTGYTAAQLAAVGVRVDPSASYAAAQMAAAGIRADPSTGYTAAQMAAVGVRPDASTGYTAAQLAAAGIHPMSTAGVSPPGLGGQQLPSGVHPALGGMGSQSMLIVKGPSGRAEGDVSAILPAGVPMMLPSGMLPVLPGQTMPPPPSESGGVTLTTRQLVATLTMTAVLSGVIGALIALLVTQNAYKPSEPGGSPAGPTVSVPAEPGGAATSAPAAVPAADSQSAAARPAPAATAAPALRPAPATADGVVDSLVLQRGGAALPPLRLASVAATGPTRQSQWLRPAGPAHQPVPPTPGAKPGPVAPGAPPAATGGKPAGEGAPAENKPAVPPAKPPVKPPGKAAPDEIGLRNPFGK